MGCYLRHDVSRCAKAVDPDGLRLARHAQGAVADQSGAHQRRGLDISIAPVDRKAIPLIGNGELGITPVDLIPGEPGAIAQILTSASAIFANPASPAEPRHSDPVAGYKAVGRLTLLDHNADDFMPGDKRQFGINELAVDDMQIGPAHRT